MHTIMIPTDILAKYRSVSSLTMTKETFHRTIGKVKKGETIVIRNNGEAEVVMIDAPRYAALMEQLESLQK